MFVLILVFKIVCIPICSNSTIKIHNSIAKFASKDFNFCLKKKCSASKCTSVVDGHYMYQSINE